MRLIDADKFKENVLSGLYIYLQVNKEDIAKAIDDEPTVEYPFYQEAFQSGYEEGKNKRPQGEWIIIDKYSDDYKCSVCNSYPLERGDYPELSKFCPTCGAKMKIQE